MTTAEFATAGDLSEDAREAAVALLRSMADDEFVLAERYTEWQVRSPTLESDLALSNIAQDEYGHARLWYDLLEDFGATESELLWEADPGAFRHATLVELPFAEGSWGDAILRGYLYDVYEAQLLDSLEESSYARIRDRVGKVLGEEDYHLTHGRNWLERLCDDVDGRAHVQDALDRLFPYALTLFEPSEHEAAITTHGIRPTSLEELRRAWLDTVGPYLEELGLDVPVADGVPTVEVPEATGRNGEHTDHWPVLHDEFTATYREMELTEPPRLLQDPDEDA